jgi:hypothetical protein
MSTVWQDVSSRCNFTLPGPDFRITRDCPQNCCAGRVAVLVNAKRLMTVPASGSHETCMGLSPVKGLFGLAGQLICDCCLGCADSSLFGAEKAVLRPVACDQVRGALGRGQGTETLA